MSLLALLRRPQPCRTAHHHTRIGIPRYGIPYWRLQGYWTDAERHALTEGRTRMIARYLLVIRRPDAHTAQQIGQSAIMLGHLTGDGVTPEALRAVLTGGGAR